MTSSKVFAFVAALLAKQFEPEVAAELRALVEQVDLQFVHRAVALLAHSGLEEGEQLTRASSVLLQYVTIQLADDLVDGDPIVVSKERAPTLQMLLWTLAFQLLCKSGVAAAARIDVLNDLLAVGAAHLTEGHTSHWSLKSASALAEALNGRQYRAYFVTLLDGTPNAVPAAEAGFLFGTVLHVGGDRVSTDARWLALTTEQREGLLRWARLHTQQLKGLALPGLEESVSYVEVLVTTPLNAGF